MRRRKKSAKGLNSKNDIIQLDKMHARITDGKKIAQKSLLWAKKEVAQLKEKKIPVGLAIVQVGENPASSIYVAKKLDAAKEIGMKTKWAKLSENVSFEEILQKITELNNDSEISGIIVQLPLPKHLNQIDVLSLVDPKKDVDGFHPQNQGMLFAGNPVFVPATVKGIMKLIQSTGTKITGKNAVVVGRSVIVGKPVAAMLVNADATVTTCHSKTKNLAWHTKQADILVVAAGKPRLIKKNMVKKGAVVIDVGTTKVRGKLCGDVDFENAKKNAGFITPVPGGVGPMTVACLIENTVQAAKSLQENINPKAGKKIHVSSAKSAKKLNGVSKTIREFRDAR